MSLLRKLALVAVLLVLVNVIIRVGTTHAGTVVALVLSWVLMGYVCWRAWPAVCSDFGRVTGAVRARGLGRGRRSDVGGF